MDFYMRYSSNKNHVRIALVLSKLTNLRALKKVSIGTFMSHYRKLLLDLRKIKRIENTVK